MRRLLFIILFLFPTFLLNAQYSLSEDEIKECETQVHQMVEYLEETLNFIGDPEVPIKEKDIVFKESYSKIFRDAEVQIEDDLDDDRNTMLNKDVQAYLKDIDFFFHNVIFNFDVQSVKSYINDFGETFFKVSMVRNIAGKTISGDTINNTKDRFLEINLDPYKKELKIVSFYTTKPNKEVELANWWNVMDEEWKKYLAKDFILYDSIEMCKISNIFSSTFTIPKKQDLILQDSFMIVDKDTLSMDRIDELYGHKPDTIIFIDDVISVWVDDTITADITPIYEALKQITKLSFVDVSNNDKITDLDPLSELTELRSLNCSNTKVSDLTPIRNLNNIKELNISATNVTDISNLKYANMIQDLVANDVDINDISVISFFKDINNLSLMNTQISDIQPLSNCPNLNGLMLSSTKIDSITPLKDLTKLYYLDISNNAINDISPLNGLINLHFLNIDSTNVTDLSALTEMSKLNEVSFSNTKISSLDALKDLSQLNKIYCDNTLITKEIADDFMKDHPHVLVINETKALELWWNSLPSFWKSLLASQTNASVNPTKEELHAIINMKSLKLDHFIQDVEPIGRLTNLEDLDLSGSKIDDLSPLYALHNLKSLNLKNTLVSDLSPLSNNNDMRTLNIENTKVSSLQPLYELDNISMIWADGTLISKDDVLELKKKQRQVSVIYQTDDLRMWWGNLSSSWKEIFNKYVVCNYSPTPEQLQNIIDLEEIEVDPVLIVQSLEPISQMMFLRKLIIDNNQIHDLTPISDKIFIEILSISGNPIDNIAALQNLNALKELNIENTMVSDLNYIASLENVKVLNIAGTSVKKLDAIKNFNLLEDLNIVNTGVKSLSPIEDLPSLKHLKVYKTKVKHTHIEYLRKKRPELNVVHF